MREAPDGVPRVSAGIYLQVRGPSLHALLVARSNRDVDYGRKSITTHLRSLGRFFPQGLCLCGCEADCLFFPLGMVQFCSTPGKYRPSRTTSTSEGMKCKR